MIFVQYKTARLDIMDKAKLKLYRTYRVALKLWNRRNPNVWAIPKKDTPESTEVMAIRKAPEKLEDTIKIREKNSVQPKNPWLAFLATHTKHDKESQTDFVKRMAKLYHSGGNKKADKKADSESGSESESDKESDKESKQKNFIQSKMATSVGVSIPVPEFKKEHKKLVKVLQTGTNKEQKKEAKEQQAELTTTIASKAKPANARAAEDEKEEEEHRKWLAKKHMLVAAREAREAKEAEEAAAKPKSKNEWIKFLAAHPRQEGENFKKYIQIMASLYHSKKAKEMPVAEAAKPEVSAAKPEVSAAKPAKPKNAWLKFMASHEKNPGESQQKFLQRMAGLWALTKNKAK